jgi:lipopolysaccharide export system protein LptA
MSRGGGAFLVGLLLFSLGGGVFARAQEGPSEQDLPVTITSDRMEGDFKAGVITFLDQVKVVRGEMILYADKVVTYPKDGGEDLERVIATGHVKVISGNRTSVADRAEYLEEGEILLLTGNAKVTDENNTLTGPLIRVYLNEDRTEVEGNTVERPKFLFYPEKGKDKAGRSGE